MARKSDLFFFKQMSNSLLSKGLWEVTPAVLDKIWKKLGLIPPDSSRVIDVKDRVSFIGYVQGFVIWVHTSFNRQTNTFTKKASLTIVISKIVNSGSKRILARFIYRKDDKEFIHRVDEYISYILTELREEWPTTKNNDWAGLKEFQHDQFFWIAKNGRKIRNFFENASAYPLVKGGEADRLYYHLVLRKRRKIKRYRRDIRKPYLRRKKK